MKHRTIVSRCLFALLVLCSGTALAQYGPAQLFQLDGNAAQTTGYNGGTCTYLNPSTQATYTAACDYWDLLNGAGTSNPDQPVVVTQNPHSGSTANFNGRTFVYGVGNTPAFTGGGSKDPHDIPDWSWSGSKTPPKDALVAAYAAAYTAPDGSNDLITIFGGERFSPNGDAFIGTWFFQKTVVPCPQPQGSPNAAACTGVASGKFSGSHTAGDILVLSNFTNGGTAPGIEVLKWDTGCSSADKQQTPGNCADANLRILVNTNSSSLLCGTNPNCAVANPITTVVQYPNGTNRNVASPLFYEGGIDVSSDLGSTPCFTSFLEETRSSQSTTAVLKDFLGGGFPVCGISIAKACPLCSIVSGSNPFSYTVQGTVTNTGLGTLYNAQVTDQSLSFDCGTLAPGQTKYWGDWTTNTPQTAVTYCNGSGAPPGSGSVTTFTSSSNPATNTASVTSSTTSGGGGVPITATVGPINCAVCPVNPGIGVTKSCTVDLVATGGAIALKVNYNGFVTNTSGNVPLSSVQLFDDDNNSLTQGGDLIFGSTAISLQPLDSNNQPTGSPCTSCTLAPGQKASYSGSYFPPTSDLSATSTTINGHGVSGLISPGRLIFYDTVKASGASTLQQNGQNPTATDQSQASCLVCPPGSAACPIQ